MPTFLRTFSVAKNIETEGACGMHNNVFDYTIK
jgi:hypothetical protein